MSPPLAGHAAAPTWVHEKSKKRLCCTLALEWILASPASCVCRRRRTTLPYLHCMATTYATGHSTLDRLCVQSSSWRLQAAYLLATTTMHAAASHRTQLQQQGIADGHVQYGGFQCRPPAPTKACMRHSRHGETPTPRRSDPDARSRSPSATMVLFCSPPARSLCFQLLLDA
jgi:hypothetical protein